MWHGGREKLSATDRRLANRVRKGRPTVSAWRIPPLPLKFWRCTFLSPTLPCKKCWFMACWCGMGFVSGLVAKVRNPAAWRASIVWNQSPLAVKDRASVIPLMWKINMLTGLSARASQIEEVWRYHTPAIAGPHSLEFKRAAMCWTCRGWFEHPTLECTGCSLRCREVTVNWNTFLWVIMAQVHTLLRASFREHRGVLTLLAMPPAVGIAMLKHFARPYPGINKLPVYTPAHPSWKQGTSISNTVHFIYQVRLRHDGARPVGLSASRLLPKGLKQSCARCLPWCLAGSSYLGYPCASGLHSGPWVCPRQVWERSRSRVTLRISGNSSATSGGTLSSTGG